MRTFLREDLPHRFTPNGRAVGVCRCRRFRRAWNCGSGPVYMVATTLRWTGSLVIYVVVWFGVLLRATDVNPAAGADALWLATITAGFLMVAWHFLPPWPEALRFGIFGEIQGTYRY